MGNIRSRIHEFLPKDLLISLNDICYDVTIPDNNAKVDMMVSVLDKHDIDYIELGPGTNRFAILINGYVFKIAMDRYGVKDNWAEFAIAKELQPYVTKTYECNGLIVVAEYVTVISKDEFIEKKDNIRQILSYLAQGYLMGDVGSISKNFMNWGYRDDGQLVILDFAYIYRIKGDEMICGGLNAAGEICEEFLEYDENFNKLTCPKCRKTYTFYDIRKKIDSEYERKEVEMSKQMAYQTTEAVKVVDGVETKDNTEPITKSDIYGKDDEVMLEERNEYETSISKESLEEMYANAVDIMPSVGDSYFDIEVEVNEEEEDENELVYCDMDEVLATAKEYTEDLDIVEEEADDEFCTDPEEDEYIYSDIKPSTISETIVGRMAEEYEEEFNEIKDDPECVVTDDGVMESPEEVLYDTKEEPEEEGVQSTITFIDNEESVEEDTIEDAFAEESDECDDMVEDDSTIETEDAVEEVFENVEVEEADVREDGDSDAFEESDYAYEEDGDDECDYGEDVDADVAEENETVEEAPSGSFIQFIEADNNPESVEEMRRSLRSDLPEDDEFDDMYEENFRDNMNYKFGKKRARE